MINKAEIECRFRRSVDSYEDNAAVQKLIVQRLLLLVKTYVSRASRTLEIGCGTGLLSEKINSLWKGNRLFVNDLVENMCRKALDRCQLPASRGLKGDIERIALAGSFDLMVSASTFQWLADPRFTFAKLAAHLIPEGWLIFSTFGKDNFKELKSITGKGLEYRSVEELTDLLSPGLEVVYSEESTHVLAFADPMEILRHVKNTGVNATDPSAVWTRGRLQEFADEYKVRFLSDGSCPLTYHPIYMVCRKK